MKLIKSIIVASVLVTFASADELSDYKAAVSTVKVIEAKVKKYANELGLKEARKERNAAKKAFESTIK